MKVWEHIGRSPGFYTSLDTSFWHLQEKHNYLGYKEKGVLILMLTTSESLIYFITSCDPLYEEYMS